MPFWVGDPARLDDIDTELTAGIKRTRPASAAAIIRADLFSILGMLFCSQSGPVATTTAVLVDPSPLVGELVQWTFTVFVGPLVMGGTFERVQSTD